MILGHTLKSYMLSTLLFIGSACLTLPDASAALPPASAPTFASISLDGKPVASTQLVGKAYIINFFASWCPPCKAEIPDMVSLQSKYGRKGFTFIGVGVNETEPAMRAFMKKNRINYPVVMVDDKLMSAFSSLTEGGINGIPTSFAVNSSGKVIRVFTGGKSKAEFEKIILEALKKPITTK